MISKQEVLNLFEKSKQTNKQEDNDLFSISVVKYFIQEFKKVLDNFNDKERMVDLRSFYLEFEKELTAKNTEPENYLESNIIDLILRVNENFSKEEAEQLMREAKEYLEN